MTDDRTARAIPRVARLIAEADALLITAGAGMGVDSGLPDFRGRTGFWSGYPALERRGLTFRQMAQPKWFVDDPQTAWAFYGHRQQLYRETRPHMGYWILRDWAQAMRGGSFVVTSNVDGQFESAGFAQERILAVHGTLFAYQCLTPCRKETWRDDGPALDIDLTSMRARGDLPRCPYCGGLARPNVLMFDDGAWVSKYRDSQRGRYLHWLAGLKGRRVVVVELGAGTAVPTIRRLGEDLVARGLASLVRINPQASEADEPATPIRMRALEALLRIEERLPEAFKAGAKAGVRIQRPTATVLPVGSGGGLEPLAARDLEMLGFDVAPVAEPGTPAWWSSAASSTDLNSVSLIDLATGQVGPFNYLGISMADVQACADCWYGPAQQGYAPLPEVGGYVEAGFRVRGGVLRPRHAVDGERPGAALMFIRGPDEEPLLTVGVVCRAHDAAFVWRHLYEGAEGRPKPLEHPRAPWVAQRLEPAAEKYAAMLPVLAEVARRLAWMWLRMQAYFEEQGRDD
jgi:NAD-dependent SIR2 family protein deacetylase